MPTRCAGSPRTRTLAKAVPLDDVRAAGWKVSVWAVTKGTDEGYAITLTHGFTNEADLARRLEDLVGTTGVLRAPVITRTRGWLRAEDAIAVTVDLRHLSTGIRSDAEVAKRLAAAGVDVDALDAQLRGQLGKALTVTVTVAGARRADQDRGSARGWSGDGRGVDIAYARAADRAARDRHRVARPRVAAHGRITCFQVAPASYVMSIMPLPRIAKPWVVVVKPKS